MTIKIGAIIKKLRAETQITQDTLATAIGVTPQAISRWESEVGYPDIELLPALADFFSVSIDELLGYKLSEREEELTSIKKEMARLSEAGTHEQRLTFARNAFAKYPNDANIKVYLAACLCDRWEKVHEQNLVNEAENLCLSVIDECHDEDTRYDAISTLSSIYTSIDNIEKAKNTLEMLAPLKYCREFALSCGIGDGNTELYIQDEIDKLTDCLGRAIYNLAANQDLSNDPSAWDKKIEMLNISNQLYKMIYGDNLMFYHIRLSRNYWLISTYQISQGKTEEALASLENMCYHAVEYDKSCISNHGKYYTSLLTDKVIYPEPGKDFHELKEHTECYHRIENLQNKRYDCVRDNLRFVLVTNKLNEYAK